MKQQPKILSLARSSVIYSIGNIGTLVINFFLVPIYTFYLTSDELGFFDVIASSLVILAPIFFAHIELSVLRWLIAEKDKKIVGKVISNGFAIFLFGIGAFSLAYYIFSLLVSWELSLLVYGYFISNFLYIIAKQVIRAVYSPLHFVGTEILHTLVVLVFILFYVGELKLKAIFLAYPVATIFLLGYLLFLRIYKYITRASISKKDIRELLEYSSPLIPNTFSLWLITMSNKYVILFYLTLSANGIYAIAFKIAYVLQILNRIFYFSFQDKMYKIYGKDGFQTYYSDIFKKYSAVLFGILFLITGSQRILLPWIIDPNFFEAMDYIPILSLGVLFMSLATIIGIIYQCEKENVHASKTSFVAGLLIVLLGVIFVPEYGLYGAAIVFAIGNLVLMIYRFYDTQRYISADLPYRQFFINIFIGTLIWYISEIDNLWAQILSLIMGIVSAFLINFVLIKRYALHFLTKLRTS